MMQIILSSGSPRRRELLTLLGVPFQVVVPEVPETPRADEAPRRFCSRVALEKAMSASARHPGAVVIGADTIVVKDGAILGKPVDEHQAREFLSLLQGDVHDVYTGYAIVGHRRSIRRVVRSRVRFKPMTSRNIDWYIQTGEPMDKAGAYAAQGIGSLFIESVSGSYTNVIGLPMAELIEDLASFGIETCAIPGG
ncbi:MAG TPA: Maf family protein [Deltaproteobacteria bacterium]|nr:Maf family protein [Deltaproteobacteria bacterium]HPP79825.1 Maf family protein [Deltaproteobacteria bacterium]